MANNKQGKCAKGCRCVKHDDTCSSDEIPNSKATQLSPEKSESMAAPAGNSSDDKSVTPDEITSALDKISDAHNRNFALFSLDKDGAIGKRDIKFGDPRRIDLLLGAAFPSSTISPSSVRHKYVVESTITRSPINFRSPLSTNLDDFSQRTSNPASFNRHSLPITEGFDTILSEINNRCKNSDSINQDMQSKLHTKNQQLSEQKALLEKSNENVRKLEQQFKDEKREKSEVKKRLMELMDERKQMEESRKEIDAALNSLRQEIQEADQSLRERASTINSLNIELDEMRRSSDTARKESQSSITQIQHDHNAMFGKLAEMHKLVNEKEADIKRMKKLYGDEAHMRKAAESEIRLVTEQGQSLMEHQKVIRLQYQDDISAHQQKVDTLSKLIGELELQNKHLVEQLTTKEEVARESLASMAEKLEQTKEVHEQQRVKDQSEIANLGRQLEAKIIVENMLQGTITGLKEEHMNTEQRLIAAQERLKIENSNLKTEIEKLKNLREEEVRDHKTKLHDAGRINKEAIELQMAKIERQKKDVDKENINLKCRIAEMEERLDDRETAVTSLKDAINELSESERQATTEYNELQLEHSQTKEQKAKILKEKEKEIDILRKSIGKFEKDSVRNLTETNEEIGSLRTKLERLTGENVELNRELASKSQELTALKSAHDEARNSADQITSMRALLSKKESSKAILLAEQQKMEREYSTALSQKTSEVNTLEQEIRALHQENASLKSKRGSAETDMGHRPQEQSVMTTNSLTSIKQQQNTGDDALTRSMLARRESSNQILAAENKKVKDELKNANTWWQRDVNELQRRHANQTSALSHMERKMTSLEMENNQLKRQSIDTCEQNKARTSSQASNNSAKEPQSSNAAYENLLDHYKRELTIKESKIKNLEASLRSAKGDTHSAIQKLESASEQEYAMKIALESKLSQNELDAEKLQSSLMEAEGFLEQKDVKATQNLLRHSNAELKILLANIKQANRSASGTLEVAAEKQTCLIKLHQRFSQSLIQIQKDAACATTQQKSEIEALNKHYEAQLSQLNDTLQSLLGDIKEKSQELTTLTGKKLELETTNKKLEERLREVKIHASNAHHDLEITRAAKQAAVTQVEELTVTVEHLQQSKGQLETKLQLAKTECAIAKDREAVEVKSKYEAKLAKMSENHQREIRDIASKMKMSEKRNSNLYVEINKLQTKVGSESKDLEMEVQDLHGQVQKLALEKSDLQERFREGLTTLKDDNDLTLRERSNHIHRLQCNNAELEAKVETLQDELRTRKEAGTKQIDELKRCKAERLDDIHKFEEKLAKSNGEVKILKDSLDIEKRQLSQTLESLTNIEVEYVKLHSHMKQTDGTSKQSESKLIGIIDKLKAENGHKSSKYKELYNENKHLRSVIKAHEGEIKMTDEKMGILKRDAQHADSVAQLYKKQFEALRKESECRMSPNRSVQSHQNMGFPKPMSVTNVYPPARIAESVDGLGAKVAELTNQITQLQNANSLLKKQNELTEIRLKDQLENGGYHHDMVKALGKQRDEYQTMVEKMTSQLENLQHQLKHQRADNDSLRTSFDMNSERLEKVTKELNVATKERESMEHKLSETSMLKTIADAKAVNEAELQRYSEELKRKLYSERESAYKIEQGLRDNSIQLQRELNTLRQNMEDAHHANKSLEAYIRNMRKSYSQVFHDAPEPQNFQSINRGSSGFMESLMYPERRMSSASKSRTKTAAPSFSYV